MDRYHILIEGKLKAERGKEKNCHLFKDVSKMLRCMIKINDMWVPIQTDPLFMCYREFDGVISVKISKKDYLKTKALLSKSINQLIFSEEVISFI